MKLITFSQLLRHPLSIFPIPEEGYEVLRRDGEGFIIQKDVKIYDDEIPKKKDTPIEK